MRVFAFDRGSYRTVDPDGRLHVAVNNISKAAVDPYYGHEIPGAAELGLDLDRLYYLLRDPDELAKAAPTFNNLPILAEHVPVSADDHQPDLVIGSTGTNAVFDAPYLRNSAVIWTRDAIGDIDAERKKQWSCAYRYRVDMTPGKFNGLRYDGIMRDIVGNHVALVETGRAGPEVMVGDAMPKGVQTMLKSRRAVLLQGALMAGIGPRLAKGAKVNFAGALDGVTASSLSRRRDSVAAAVVRLATPHLAADEGVAVSDVVEIIDAVQGMAGGSGPAEDDDLNAPMDMPPAVDEEDDTASKMLAYCKGKMSEDDYAGLASMANGGTMDEDPDEDDDDDDDKKPAMDAASVRRSTIQEMHAIREAERAVEPFVGPIAVAMDSAADVYRLALDARGVDLEGVPAAAFKAMVGLLAAPASASPAHAMDAATADDFHTRFPGARRLVARS